MLAILSGTVIAHWDIDIGAVVSLKFAPVMSVILEGYIIPE